MVTTIETKNRERIDVSNRAYHLYALMILSMVLPIFSSAQSDTLLLKLDRPYVYKGLSLTLLHRTEYNPMTGASVFLRVMYRDRQDIISVGLATCEADLDMLYRWEGYVFKLPNSIKNNSVHSIELIISEEKTTSIDEVYGQENLQWAFDKLKQEMNIADNQTVRASGIKVESDSITLYLEYQSGKIHHVYDWQKFIAEQIQVKGEILKQDLSKCGFVYRLLKSENGDITIFSSPLAENERGIDSSLNYLFRKLSSQ